MRRVLLIGRLKGWALLLGALAAVGYEAFGWWRDGVWESVSFGAAWASFNANSLVGLGAFIEKSVSPWLWSEIMIPVLLQPLWLVLALPGALLTVTLRSKRRRSIFY
jgi:hypothetical protein